MNDQELLGLVEAEKQLHVMARKYAAEIMDELETTLFERGSDLGHDYDAILSALVETTMALDALAPWPDDVKEPLRTAHGLLIDAAMEREDRATFILAFEVVNILASYFGEGVRGPITQAKETHDHNDNPSD